jgi:hypothetical protein
MPQKSADLILLYLMSPCQVIVSVYVSFFLCLAYGSAQCRTSRSLILICSSRFTLCVSFQFTKLRATEMEPDVREGGGHRKWSVNASSSNSSSSSSSSCLAVTWGFLLAAFVVWIKQREPSVCPSVRVSKLQVLTTLGSTCSRDKDVCSPKRLAWLWSPSRLMFSQYCDHFSSRIKRSARDA